MGSESLYSSDTSENGNALFLILIAVALFAALSYAITQSSRSGGSATSEENIIYAGQIVQAGVDMKTGMTRMILTGTPVKSIVTGSPGTQGYAGYGTLSGADDFCTAGATCLFAPDGGGVSVPSLPRQAFLPGPTHMVTSYGISSYFAGAGSFNGVNINGLSPAGGGSAWIPIPNVGTAAADDLVEFWPLTEGVCLAIDKGLGLSSIPVDASQGDSQVTAAAGMESACLTFGDEPDTYWYYQVLSAN